MQIRNVALSLRATAGSGCVFLNHGIDPTAIDGRSLINQPETKKSLDFQIEVLVSEISVLDYHSTSIWELLFVATNITPPHIIV